MFSGVLGIGILLDPGEEVRRVCCLVRWCGGKCGKQEGWNGGGDGVRRIRKEVGGRLRPLHSKTTEHNNI